MLPSISCTICHPEPAKDPRLRRSQQEADRSSPALREASLRAEPMGLPCAKRACERSPRACPARSEPASGAHGFLLRMTRNSGWEAFRSTQSLEHQGGRALRIERPSCEADEVLRPDGLALARFDGADRVGDGFDGAPQRHVELAA